MFSILLTKLDFTQSLLLLSFGLLLFFAIIAIISKR